ncbi:ABC transporter substrate-binding protein [Alteromonas halophila]|uniref:Uncharacterized protein n=1 Tax=Alteromonas halophila TaxID=516698 RepID=A0A918N0W7_9ALTE|nr:ABC transporter substrate-binding protein [Alteromonas halophila]GGW95260.1 hypothetical protein GCM10007391_31910 [Alteromonas halophila]
MRVIAVAISALIVGLSALCVNATTLIRVGTYQDHTQAIKSFLGQNGCESLATASVGENQILAEYLIFCNALKQSDGDYDIQLYSYPLNARILDDIESGFLDASVIGIWQNELHSHDYVASAPLLRRNEFVKGLYTTKEQLSVLSRRASLHGSVVLVNSNWYHDWAMLNCSSLKPVHVDKYENMFRMLSAQRGDVIPLTFSNKPDMERNQFGIPLFPVPGFKLAFDDTTHYAISTKTDSAQALRRDINAGLAVLREKGLIEALYTRLGIIDSAVSDWQQIGVCDNG